MNWSPGRVATFGAGEWIVMVTDNGKVRIWRSPDPAFTMLEVSAFDLRRALGKLEGAPTASVGGWTVENVEKDGVYICFRDSVRNELEFGVSRQSAANLRNGLGRALDAIQRHHGHTLAEMEANGDSKERP